jgi:hypothetical protein
MALVDRQSPLLIKQKHFAQPHGADRNHIKFQDKRVNNLMLSGFKHSPASAHHLRFLREVSLVPDRPPPSGLSHKPLSQFFDDPYAFIQSIWDDWTSDPRDFDNVSHRLEQLSHFLCQRGRFNADYLLDRNVFHAVIDVIRDFPNANKLQRFRFSQSRCSPR